ncbi:MAG: hypothetical protein EOO68_07350 [Moraxellaceae bacterium]|nr:MAG: hypothetical protein EOO68_07350 [Moraxellaceae bacterium]
MQHDWTIQGRGTRCAVTGEPFKDGEFFYTLLFDEVSGYRREDLSEAAWKARPKDAPKPFSFWRSKFEVPPPPAPEAFGKQTAEDLLRRYMEENNPQYTNACYILALMLERKRIFKQIDRKKGDDGRFALIYEHSKTGEVFVVLSAQCSVLSAQCSVGE